MELSSTSFLGNLRLTRGYHSLCSGIDTHDPAGQIGGHEGIGNIIQLGAGLEDSGKKVGDRGCSYFSLA